MKGDPKRRALGKGLGSLIPDRAPGDDPLATTIGAEAVPAATASATTEVPIDAIDTNPNQPRSAFDDEAIEQLAASIRVNGVLQPLLVRPAEREGSWILVAGERRLRAARRAGLTRVPVVVRELADDRTLEVALVENVQREDLDPIEFAAALRRLVRETGLTQKEIAERIGKPRSTIANHLRLLELPAEVQQMLREGRLEFGHGRALAALTDPARQLELARRAAARGWSVRQVEEQVRRILSATPAARAVRPGGKDPNVAAAEETLSRALGAKTTIHQTRSGRGRIEIRFADTEQLEALYRALLRARDTSAGPRD